MTTVGGPWDAIPKSPYTKTLEDLVFNSPAFPDSESVVTCPRCKITFNLSDTIITYEEISEPGKATTEKTTVRALIRLTSLEDSIEYSCEVCGYMWSGAAPTLVPMGGQHPFPLGHDYSDLPTTIFHEGEDRPIGSAHPLVSDESILRMEDEAAWALSTIHDV
jgi:rubredoxin